MDWLTFGIIAVSGLLPLTYMGSRNRLHIVCNIVVMVSPMFAALPLMLVGVHPHTHTAALIALAAGGLTTLLLYLMNPPKTASR